MAQVFILGLVIGLSIGVIFLAVMLIIQRRRRAKYLALAIARQKERDAASEKLLSSIDLLVERSQAVYEATQTAKERALVSLHLLTEPRS